MHNGVNRVVELVSAQNCMNKALFRHPAKAKASLVCEPEFALQHKRMFYAGHVSLESLIRQNRNPVHCTFLNRERESRWVLTLNICDSVTILS